MIDLGLTGKRAVVAGAGYIRERAGHGWYTSIRLAEAGASVACIDIDESRALEVAAELSSRGATAYAIVADVTQAADVQRALDEATSRMGGIDLVVDIVGAARWETGRDTSDEDFDWAIRTNLSQVFYLFREAGKQMITQGTGGSLIALASVDGINAANGHVPYGAAKAGVIHLVKSFACEFGRYGIRVNAVAPGSVGSGNHDQPEEQFPLDPIHPLAAPRTIDIANAALFLSSSLAARITGQTLVVDGGAGIRDLWGLDPENIPAMFREQRY